MSSTAITDSQKYLAGEPLNMGKWPHLDTEVTAQETDNAETRPNPS